MYDAVNITFPRMYHLTGLTLYQTVSDVNSTLEPMEIQSIQYSGNSDKYYETYQYVYEQNVSLQPSEIARFTSEFLYCKIMHHE